MPRSAQASSIQFDLFAQPAALPEGFTYTPDFLSKDEEGAMAERFSTLPFKEFEFQGFVGKRRTVSFGWRYDFNGGGLQQTDDMPDFLLPFRLRAAAFAGLNPGDLQQALLLEYPPGAQIGWHRDRPMFDEIVGISLLSPCTFRLRRKTGSTWQRASVVAEPRSIYVMKGPSRSEWEHSVPAVDALRYSVTFRNFRG